MATRCISTDEQTDDDFDINEAVTPLACCVPNCEKLQMPFTTYCLAHITKDKKQRMFTNCGDLKGRNGPCDIPVLIWDEEEGCPLHCGELPPDLPMDEEEKEHIIEAESKQMISVNDEGKAVESLLFCQLADMEHLNQELENALQSGYLSTDSESDKDSTDDERKLTPLNEEAYLNDPDDDIDVSYFDKRHDDDIIEEDEDYVQEFQRVKLMRKGKMSTLTRTITRRTTKS